VGRRRFAGCHKAVVVVEHREVAAEGMEVVVGCIGAGVGTDSEERRSPDFEEEESHSSELVGKASDFLGVRSWAEGGIAADFGAGSVVADGLGLVHRNSRCLTSCLLFWRALRRG
jgi:hypothetical protein